jgi:diaminopimelate decarboxylase
VGFPLDDPLSVRDGRLFVEDCDTLEVAQRFGTPLYVLSEERLRTNARRYRAAFAAAWPHGDIHVLPSLKANFSLAAARVLVEESLGCDVFGPSEFEIAMRSGFAPELVSLNGSTKDQALIDAAVAAGVRITLDDPIELERAREAAERVGRVANVRLRCRPDYRGLELPTDFVEEELPVSEAARRYKAGIPSDALAETGRRALADPAVHLSGLMVHFPRHRTELEVWHTAADRFADLVVEVCGQLGGWRPEELDVGGGLPTRRDPTGRLLERIEDEGRSVAPDVGDYAVTIADALSARLRSGSVDPSGIALEVEPGRGLFADAGLHLTTVRNVKRERAPQPWRWVETDTSEMFLLDSLIEHNRWLVLAAGRVGEPSDGPADVVGRSCGFDLMVPDVELPDVGVGDVLAFLDTGAYQDASATNFNAMPRPASVLVHGDGAELIKRAETVDDVLGRDVVPDRLGVGASR